MQDQVPDRQEIRELLSAEGGLRVSILMPGHLGGEGVAQDPIRLKNLLDEAECQLVSLGVKAREAAGMLSEARAWVMHDRLLRQQSRGVAVFIDERGMRRFRVPMELEEVVVVGEHFHVAPLLPLVQEDGRVFVLTLSGKRVRLLECSRTEVREVEVPRMPGNFEEYAKFIDRQAEGQWYTEAYPTAAGQRGRQAVFFGGGAAGDDPKRWQVDFCRLIEAAVTRRLNPEGAPLMLAGTQPLEGMYREVNSYPLLLAEVLEGNADHMDAKEVRERVWPIVEQRLEGQVMRDVEGVRRALDQGASVAVTGTEEVLPASLDGRVGVLLCASDDHVWGRFEEDQRRVEEHDRRRPGDEDLLNVAAVMAAKSGSVVHTLRRERMPGRANVAALLRY